MEEDALRFWIIPIICLVIVMGFFVFSLNYKINIIFPNAELERQEIKEMACPEILLKDSSNRYWTSANAQIGKAKALGCKVPQESSDLSPYVEFCTPGGFAPVKKIDNSTHSFNHDTCVWDLR